METGRAAESWLEERLVADERWDDGIPDDAEPWVAAAFADVASMSVDELSTAADAPAHDAELARQTPRPGDVDDVDNLDDVDAVAPTGAGLDDWLGNHPSFEAVDDVHDFTVDDDDLTDALDHLPPSAPVPSQSGLVDPFDEGSIRTVAPDAGNRGGEAEDLSDDIVTTPTLADLADSVVPDESIDFDSPGSAASMPAVPAADTLAPFSDFGGGDVASVLDQVPDTSLVGDPFDELHFDAATTGAAEHPSGDASGEVGDDLLDEFGDDDWAND